MYQLWWFLVEFIWTVDTSAYDVMILRYTKSLMHITMMWWYDDFQTCCRHYLKCWCIWCHEFFRDAEIVRTVHAFNQLLEVMLRLFEFSILHSFTVLYIEFIFLLVQSVGYCCSTGSDTLYYPFWYHWTLHGPPVSVI